MTTLIIILLFLRIINCQSSLWMVDPSIVVVVVVVGRVFHMCAIKRDEKLDDRMKKKEVLGEPCKGLCVLRIPLKGFSYLWQVYIYTHTHTYTVVVGSKDRSMERGDPWRKVQSMRSIIRHCDPRFSSHYNFRANLLLNQDLQRSR
jgi:hypothetical protein